MLRDSLHGVSGGAVESLSPLARVKRIKSAVDARKFLGLSQSELAKEISTRLGLRFQMDRSTIANYEARVSRSRKTPPRKIPDAQVQIYGQLILNKLATLLDREDVRMRVTVNSPWHIWVGVWCSRCRKHHDLRRANQWCKKQLQVSQLENQ
jgi:hypothetical protein